MNADIIGMSVGAAAHFAAMIAFIAEKGLKPVIDQEFSFEAAADAYDRLRIGGYFGQLVVFVAG